MAGEERKIYSHTYSLDDVAMLPRSDKITLLNGLAVHCLMSGADTWVRIMPLLPVVCSAYALDIRGFGQSAKPADGCTYDILVEDPAAFF